MTKRKFKFKVILIIEELNAVPFVTDVLFCKVRLRNGGTYTGSTNRQTVSNHSVYWQQRFEFACKMTADPRNGILEPCVTRLSVRKEVRGGRGATKIGFVDLNLAEFAGSNQRRKHCLLEGYSHKIRLNNSILKIMVSMQLLSGDPLFKTPSTQQDTTLGLASDPSESLPSAVDNVGSGVGSWSRKSSQIRHADEVDSFETGHNRNSSALSHVSKKSDCNSKHSRSPSNISQCSSSAESKDLTNTQGLPKTPASIRLVSKLDQIYYTTIDGSQNRMGETRVDAVDIVSKLIASQDFSSNSKGSDGDNLQLYVASDGSTALSGQNLHNRVDSGVYHPVIFETNSLKH